MNIQNQIKVKDDILSFLLLNKDEEYRDFTSKLIPTIDKDRIIGVRTPVLRNLTKAIKGTEVMNDFLSCPQHTYLEENHLHGFLIETIPDFDKALKLTNDFIPYIDNWATCDTMRPKIFRKHPDEVFEHIKVWLHSNETYTVRYAIGLLNSFYLDENFSQEHLSLVGRIESDDYYINMMIAWYFATALYKQRDAALVFIEQRKLKKWVHNKAITKARESLRIDKECKDYLNTLKIK